MQTIYEKEQELIEEFSFFDDWSDKYAHIIEMGKGLEALEEIHKTEENIIKGCQSKVWLVADFKEGKIQYRAESDALIVKGLVAMMLRLLSGHTPEEILGADLKFLEKIGLHQHLSPTRSNGLASMIKQMKLFALGYQAKQHTSYDRDRT